MLVQELEARRNVANELLDLLRLKVVARDDAWRRCSLGLHLWRVLDAHLDGVGQAAGVARHEQIDALLGARMIQIPNNVRVNRKAFDESDLALDAIHIAELARHRLEHTVPATERRGKDAGAAAARKSQTLVGLKEVCLISTDRF